MKAEPILQRPLQDRSICLVGLRGAGKSTVGLLLAQRLGRPFVDLDAAVEGRTGRDIRSLFAEEGEEAFRTIEAETLVETLRLVPGAVVATGGGVVLRSENREALASARVVYLQAPVEILAQRVEADPGSEASRPALVPGGALTEAQTLFEARDPHYRALAEAVVDATPAAAAVVDALIQELALRPNEPGPARDA